LRVQPLQIQKMKMKKPRVDGGAMTVGNGDRASATGVTEVVTVATVATVARAAAGGGGALRHAAAPG